MKYILPALQFKEDALEPVISRKTINYHYGKHTKAYFDNLNKLIENSSLNGRELEEIIINGEGAIFNNAAQAWNHIFYFEQFAGEKNSKLQGSLRTSIERNFGSEIAFKELFIREGINIFGSGWVWLSTDVEGNLQIDKCHNADNPILKKRIPLLTFDVWEHAYYLDYQNLRAEHLSALWMILNWSIIEKRYNERTIFSDRCF
ncbi:MAG: superoxide dismutase [Bacteroidales bacterium]|nr:superoxide dismutase [Bacteroidales bacterium]